MLTLAQLYDLGINAGIDIFSGISLPANSPINRTLLINSIMEHCGLNTPLYADPFVMSSAIALWSAKNQYTFEHIGKILTADYSPIENTDKYETVTTDHSRDLTDNTTGNNKKNEKLHSTNNENVTGSENHSGTDTDTTTLSGSDTVTEESETSAFNSSTYQPDNKTTTTTQPGSVTTENMSHGENIANTSQTNSTGDSTKDTNVDLKNDKKVKETEKTTVTTRTHGNIGVMDNATMQEREYDLIGKFNPYTFICGLFENELTLFVY